VRRPETITERVAAIAAAPALTTDSAVVEVSVRVVQRRVGQLRALAFKWVRVRWRCWQDRTPYQEARYVAALRSRGVSVTPEVIA
jgi:hypothetical protein